MLIWSHVWINCVVFVCRLIPVGCKWHQIAQQHIAQVRHAEKCAALAHHHRMGAAVWHGSKHICICSPFATILQIERQSARCMCRMHFHFHYHWPGAIAKGSEIKNTNGCASLDNTDSVHFPMRFGANDVLQPEPSATASCSDVYF